MFQWEKEGKDGILLSRITFSTLCIKIRDRLLNLNRTSNMSQPHAEFFMRRFSPGEKVIVKNTERTVTICRFSSESVFQNGFCILYLCTIGDRKHFLQCNQTCIWKEEEYRTRFGVSNGSSMATISINTLEGTFSQTLQTRDNAGEGMPATPHLDISRVENVVGDATPSTVSVIHSTQ